MAIHGALRERIVRIAATCGARNVRVFGFRAWGGADDRSDIDHFATGTPPRNERPPGRSRSWNPRRGGGIEQHLGSEIAEEANLWSGK
ncbi:MAG: hypothetical protein KatS3mg076_1843 [Candidatus Binatia bacterium]|nr:MAG: hypothetical protein KatS3mg076_1843 [Candidatus Binatia bacterium]